MSNGLDRTLLTIAIVSILLVVLFVVLVVVPSIELNVVAGTVYVGVFDYTHCLMDICEVVN